MGTRQTCEHEWIDASTIDEFEYEFQICCRCPARRYREREPFYLTCEEWEEKEWIEGTPP